MCGIVGYYSRKENSLRAEETIWNMTNALQHRGPNDQGIWKDKDLGILFGHRRLSILDLSQAGHQPMISHCANYVILLNGEIYNHLELRKEFPDTFQWRGSSDTETVVECVAEWGLGKTLDKLEGMFSIALWDIKKKELSLVRDPFGEKPLYYGWQGDYFFFSSELKALKRHPEFNPAIDRNSLSLYFRHNCIPAPYSIYKGINKLLPGSCLVIDFKNINNAMQAKPFSYYNLNEVIQTCKTNYSYMSEADLLIEAEHQLERSVKQQMLSDVPLGAFLSGGIDSSSIVALMQKNSIEPIKTFTIGFKDINFDEAIYANDVAKYLGTDHQELYVTSDDAISIIPSLPSIYCEPFSDSSQIPTYLVSRLASERVTVSLSGDGGDEIFGGYNRYIEGKNTWENFNRLPKQIRHSFGKLLISFSPNLWDKCFNAVKHILPKDLRFTSAGDKAHKLAEVLFQDTQREFYTILCSHWKNPDNVVLGSKEYSSLISNENEWLESDNFIEQMMAMDTRTYLPDDILVKVDRAAMACSLETRIPMLSKNVVEFAWSLPIEQRIKEGKGKWPLRQVLYKYVPEHLIERPKHGFGIPVGEWLRDPLYEWASDLLSEQSLLQSGYLNPKPVIKMWKEHSNGTKNWQYHLWDVLMFENWLKDQKI